MIDVRQRLQLPSGSSGTVIERRHAALLTAIDDALRATEQAIRQSVGRRRITRCTAGTRP